MELLLPVTRYFRCSEFTALYLMTVVVTTLTPKPVVFDLMILFSDDHRRYQPNIDSTTVRPVAIPYLFSLPWFLQYTLFLTFWRRWWKVMTSG